jgi:DNA-directed RNA polymerase subunit F
VVKVKENEIKPISLAEVKNILKKMSKDRKELLYEQRIALEHAQKFVKMPMKKTVDLIKELKSLEFLNEIHAIKIADLLPTSKDDVKAIFAKERITLGENDIKKILDIVAKYYIE